MTGSLVWPCDFESLADSLELCVYLRARLLFRPSELASVEAVLGDQLLGPLVCGSCLAGGTSILDCLGQERLNAVFIRSFALAGSPNMAPSSDRTEASCVVEARHRPGPLTKSADFLLPHISDLLRNVRCV